MKRFSFYFCLCFFALALFGCGGEGKKLSKIKLAKSKAIADFVENLEEEVKISQLFLLNIEGSKTFTPVENCGLVSGNKEKPLLAGGCLFFGYNIAPTKDEVKLFINSIETFYLQNQNPPPFMAIDQEGGEVNRLKKLTDIFPSNKAVASTMSLAQAEELYKKQAEELFSLGFNMNLAPVVEVETAKNSDFLGTRSFGNLEKVLTYAPLEISALEDKGVLTVLKHFPGNSNTDPHTGLPEIRVGYKELNDNFLLPFKNLLPLSSAVLMSHARLSFVKSMAKDEKPEIFESDIFLNVEGFVDEPACLSNFWVSKVLRDYFSFTGLIISDDIFMGALVKNGYPPELAAVKAIENGVDIIMLSEKRFGKVAKLLLDTALYSPDFGLKIDQAVSRVIEYKIRAGLLEFEEVEPFVFKVGVSKRFIEAGLGS